MLNVYEIPLVPGEWCVVDSEASRPSDSHRQQPRTTYHAFYFLDLPGYGFARASQADRRAFHLLITHTLARPGLTGVLWLLDIRHAPSADDRDMHELFAGRKTRVLAALTKSDKLPRGQRVSRERELREALALDDDQVILTSVRENEGIEELRESIKRFVG